MNMAAIRILDFRAATLQSLQVLHSKNGLFNADMLSESTVAVINFEEFCPC